MELNITREQSKVIVIVIALLAAVGLSWWWMSRPTAVALTMPTTTASPGATEAVAMSAYVVVDVVGAVRSPGVIHLPAGSRVIDAVDAAGGAKAGVAPGVNLARVLQDGEQIVVGEAAPSSASVGGKLNLNRATQQQLEDLPGVGPVLAQRIIDYRDQHGGFRSVAQLDDVSGVGPAMMASLSEVVSVG